jgi:hypothetical protein
MPTNKPQRANLGVVVSVAVVAYVADDLIHEVLGHGALAWLTGIPILSLSTVALQTGVSSRLVAAAGTVANAAVGLAAFWLLSRGKRLSRQRYFLWLLGALNLMNASGYLWSSAILGSGDWAVVIGLWHPQWLLRLLMGGLGIVLYVWTVRVTSDALKQYLENGGGCRDDVPRLALAPYLTGGVLMMAAAARNPVGPILILTSGAAASFGLMAGLLVVATRVRVATTAGERCGRLEWSSAWAGLAATLGVVFIFVIGPGIRF